MSSFLKLINHIECSLPSSAILRSNYGFNPLCQNYSPIPRIKSPPYSKNQIRHLFYEKDKKGGYDTKSKEHISNLQHIRLGFKELKAEIKLWKEEIKDNFLSDPLVYYQAGVTDLIWDFRNPENITKFLTTSDKDHNEGRSTCTFQMSKAGRALFSGNLDTTTPKDGRVKKAGYCNIRTPRIRKSFKRDSTYDWTMYNTLVLKVRGDGRPYMINLSTEGYFDMSWNDIYQFVLYTRGGPYWQTAKIPFSKFFLASRGVIQDKQSRIPLDKVTHFGISCGNKVNGPFFLEIEHIGLELDPQHNEEFAYELYRTDSLIAQA